MIKTILKLVVMNWQFGLAILNDKEMRSETQRKHHCQKQIDEQR
jgi:hypothetical protein